MKLSTSAVNFLSFFIPSLVSCQISQQFLTHKLVEDSIHLLQIIVQIAFGQIHIMESSIWCKKEANSVFPGRAQACNMSFTRLWLVCVLIKDEYCKCTRQKDHCLLVACTHAETATLNHTRITLNNIYTYIHVLSKTSSQSISNFTYNITDSIIYVALTRKLCSLFNHSLFQFTQSCYFILYDKLWIQLGPPKEFHIQ